MDENPYAPPRGVLHEQQMPAPLPGWSSAQLRVLGWLGLAFVLVALVAILLSLPIGGGGMHAAGYANGLGLMTALLGGYLSLRLKRFIEVRFAGRALGGPVWLCILLGLLLGGAGSSLDRSSQWSGWLPVLHGLGLIGFGVAAVWLGVRLLGVSGVYRALRVMAWLLIAGGLMLASLRLTLPATLCLLGAGLAQARVFFRGCAQASERR